MNFNSYDITFEKKICSVWQNTSSNLEIVSFRGVHLGSPNINTKLHHKLFIKHMFSLYIVYIRSILRVNILLKKLKYLLSTKIGSHKFKWIHRACMILLDDPIWFILLRLFLKSHILHGRLYIFIRSSP